MLLLDATTKTLEAVLAGSVTTNQLPLYVSYYDNTATTFVPGTTDTATNNTTAVTIVAAPASSTQRQVKSISAYNADTAAATVTIRLNDNGTTRIIFKAALSIGDNLLYEDGKGFVVIDNNGNTKTIQSAVTFSSLAGQIAQSQIPTNELISNVGVTVTNGSTTIVAGQVGYVVCPFGGTITGWSIVADQGTCTFDVWKIASGTAVPTVANTIVASAAPALATGTAIESTTLTGWTTSVTAGDIFGFNLTAVASATKITLQIKLTRS